MDLLLSLIRAWASLLCLPPASGIPRRNPAASTCPCRASTISCWNEHFPRTSCSLRRCALWTWSSACFVTEDACSWRPHSDLSGCSWPCSAERLSCRWLSLSSRPISWSLIYISAILWGHVGRRRSGTACSQWRRRYAAMTIWNRAILLALALMHWQLLIVSSPFPSFVES